MIMGIFRSGPTGKTQHCPQEAPGQAGNWEDTGMSRPPGTVLDAVNQGFLGFPVGQVGSPWAKEQHSWATLAAGLRQS